MSDTNNHDDSSDSKSIGKAIQQEWAEFTKDTDAARRKMEEAIDEAFKEKWSAGEITAIVVGVSVLAALLAIAIWKIYEVLA